MLWEYRGAYRRTQLFTSGEGCGLRIFLGALDWLGQGEFKRKVMVLPRRRTTQGQSKVMTVREVSAYLRVHPSTVYRLLEVVIRKIPAFHIGSDWRFNIEEIDRWRLAHR